MPRLAKTHNHNWNEIFEYRDGELYWKIKRNPRVLKGSLAGWLDINIGYWRVQLDNKLYLLHRIIYEMFYEKLTDIDQVDHIDQNKLNNTINNLRKVTHRENGRNKPKQSNNTSGYCGVSWYKNYSKWLSYIIVEGKRIHLGYFTDMKDAIVARKDAENKYGFHKNHGK